LGMGLIVAGTFQVGQVVISRKGKDTGKWYVVVKVEPEKNRAYLSDGKRFQVSAPKLKNLSHLQPTRWVLEEIAGKISRGENIDSGRLQYLFSQVRNIVSSESDAGRLT
jgi:ribosomal protein L14E/L6E/L27E